MLAIGVRVASFYYKSTFGEAGVSVLVSTAYTFGLKFVEFRGKTQFWSKLYSNEVLQPNTNTNVGSNTIKLQLN